MGVCADPFLSSNTRLVPSTWPPSLPRRCVPLSRVACASDIYVLSSWGWKTEIKASDWGPLRPVFWARRWPPPLCPHVAFSLSIHTLANSFYSSKGTSPTGKGPALVTSFHIDRLLKYSHILRYRGLRPQHIEI